MLRYLDVEITEAPVGAGHSDLSTSATPQDRSLDKKLAHRMGAVNPDTVSKVVDARGELVVYHTSRTDITAFDRMQPPLAQRRNPPTSEQCGACRRS